MRATTVFRRLLCLASVTVDSFVFSGDGLVLDVKPRWRRPRCSGCGRKTEYAEAWGRHRLWRHLPFGGVRVYLLSYVRRVRCPRCGLRVEKLPWVGHTRDRFTAAFSELIACLAQQMPHNQVARRLGVSWPTVGAVARRVAEAHLACDRLGNLRRIGVDEFYWAKKRFLTVVWDHDRSRVVWVGSGKTADVLRGFFRELGPERCREIKVVTGDMSHAYLQALRTDLPQAQVVIDTFHVLRLAHEAVDEVRRQTVRELRKDDQVKAKAVKRSRYVLFKPQERMSLPEKLKLEAIARSCKPLHRAFDLKEMLGYVLRLRDPEEAERMLRRLISRMARSRLKPFRSVVKTLRKHFDGIIASIRYQLTNGPIEGNNRKIRGLLYRAYGYRAEDNLIAAIYLNCSGIEIPWPMAK